MSKKRNEGIHGIDKENTDAPERRGAASAGRKTLRVLGRAVDLTIDLTASSVVTVFKAIGTVLLILMVTGMMFACVFAYYVKTCLTPNLDLSLEDFKLNESSTIWYRDGSGEWRELVKLSGVENRVWVSYEDIPWFMEKALVAIEDKRFYDHKGVDWYRTFGAFVEMFARMQTSYGGSTITQQLIKNLTGEDEVTIQRKLTEIFGALELEKKYDKQEIMEWYLNAVYFGEGCWGVQTAAQTYFGKNVSDLSLAECAAIVGITNLPTYYDPFYNEENNKRRQETILREMYEQGFIDYQMYCDAVAEELVFTRSPGERYTQEIMSYYTEMVIDDVTADLMKLKGIGRDTARTLLYNGGYQIFCCLDTNVQAAIDAVYTDPNSLPYSVNGQPLQSAIVVMNPYDGRILGISGGIGPKTINFGLNRATGTYRSPGSSIKPIASYGPAVDLGLITPDTLVVDSQSISLKGTSWFPMNDDRNSYGTLSILSALQYSLNTVAAQIVDKLPMGPQTSYDYLTTRLGVSSLVPADCDYAPMALGQLTNGVCVRDMCQAYCAFVNDGVFTYGRSYAMVTDSEGNIVIDNSPNTIQAFKPNTAHVMTYMLQNAAEHGTGREAALWTVPVAGKTGTSGDYKDRWFVGCTPYYVAAVWTGFDIPSAIQSTSNPSAQLWRRVMAPIHEGLEYVAFPYPQLGPNTGIFDIYDTSTGYYDEYAGNQNNNGTIGYGDSYYGGGGNNADYGGNDFLGFGGSDMFLG